eukprot:jgi/Bigna1/78889/fgenesh1_pg.58_\
MAHRSLPKPQTAEIYDDDSHKFSLAVHSSDRIWNNIIQIFHEDCTDDYMPCGRISLAVGDIAKSLGIKKTKVGGGDKDVAYIVDSNTMTYGLWIIAAVLMCFAIGFVMRNFELQIKNKNYVGALEQADEMEELALERVMEIGLTLEDFLRREAAEEDMGDPLEKSLMKSQRSLLGFLQAKLSSADAIKAQSYLRELMQPVVRFLEDRKAEAVEAKMVLGEVNQMLGQDDLVPEAPVDNTAWMPQEHQWEMNNLKKDQWGHKDYKSGGGANPSFAAGTAHQNKQKTKAAGLTHGRDLSSRIAKFFEGVKAATDVSFPQGFAEKFFKFKQTLGANVKDPEAFAAAGRRRWNTLSKLLKDSGIIDVDARALGDEKLKERLLYMMYHEVDAILEVKKHAKVLNTLKAGYDAGNLAGGELMRILHSQKGLHEAFDWLFGSSDNAEIIDSSHLNDGPVGVAGGSRAAKPKVSRTAKKITEDFAAPMKDSSKARNGINTAKTGSSAKSSEKSKFIPRKKSPSAGAAASKTAPAAKSASVGRTRGGASKARDDYDLGKVPASTRGGSKHVDNFLAESDEIEGYLDGSKATRTAPRASSGSRKAKTEDPPPPPRQRREAASDRYEDRGRDDSGRGDERQRIDRSSRAAGSRLRERRAARNDRYYADDYAEDDRRGGYRRSSGGGRRRERRGDYYEDELDY